jgi:hypothetical protein
MSYKLVYFLSFLLSIIFAFITASTIHNKEIFRKQFSITLEWLIIFSVSMFFLQFIVFYLSNNVLPIHKFIFPFSEARIGVLEISNSILRLGGLYIEPGTYCNWMYLFLVIYILISDNVKKSLLYIVAISMIMSYSVWGIIFGSYLLIILIIIKLKKFTWKKRIMLFLILLLMSYSTIEYISNSSAIQYSSNKINSNNGSVTAKEMTFKNYKDNFTNFLIIGEGLNPPFYKKLTSPQDSGFILNLSIIIGIFFTIIILLIYTISFFKYSNSLIFLISLPIFFSKINYYEASFWLLFFIIIYKGHSTYQKNISLNKIGEYND